MFLIRALSIIYFRTKSHFKVTNIIRIKKKEEKRTHESIEDLKTDLVTMDSPNFKNFGVQLFQFKLFVFVEDETTVRTSVVVKVQAR